MTELLTSYDVLGLKTDAPYEEVQRKYRKLVSKTHPDKGGDPIAFNSIVNAYRFLTTHYSNLNSQPVIVKINEDIEIKLTISLEQSFNGGRITVDYKLISGEITTSTIDIPLGVKHNQKAIYHNLGDDAIDDVPRGNLIVQYILEHDENYSRLKDDLFALHTISVFDALLGCNVTAIGMDTVKYTISIPPGTQPEERFTVKGKGFYNNRTQSFGDFIVIIDVYIPKITNINAINMLTEIKNLL